MHVLTPEPRPAPLLVINGFSSLFGPPAEAGKPAQGDYPVTAYFSAELGGDTFEGVLAIAK